MDNPTYYEIRIEGQLSDRWSDWFDGLEIRNEAEGESLICGSFVDQASLMGLLTKIQGLNLRLISVKKIPNQ